MRQSAGAVLRHAAQTPPLPGGDLLALGLPWAAWGGLSQRVQPGLGARSQARPRGRFARCPPLGHLWVLFSAD